MAAESPSSSAAPAQSSSTAVPTAADPVPSVDGDPETDAPAGTPIGVGRCQGTGPNHVGLQRLTSSQLQHTLSDLFGFEVAAPPGSSPDYLNGGYFGLPEAQLASAAYVEQHLDWTLSLVKKAVGDAAPSVVSCELDGAGCTSEILTRFVERAFRRPPTDAEIAHFDAVFVAASGDPATRLVTTLTAVLNAPQFLFRERQTQNPNEPTPLTDYDIASRLSYFLWDTMPDTELLEAAGNGELGEPAMLEAQLLRMLQSPNIERLGRSIAFQWLELGRLSQHELSTEAFPEYDEGLQAAMLEEAVRFVTLLLEEDRPVADLLRARESFVNEALAGLYGLEGTFGDEFERVDLSEGAPRFGLLGLAAPLALTSSGEETSIIRRGKWVSEALLCTEIPPPPPELDTEFSDEIPDDATPRERVELHRQKPECAVCHDYLDPPGLLLEIYDPLGRHRTEYPAPIDEAIDTATVLPDGTEIADLAEFVEHVTADERLLRCATDRLFPVSVGRLLEPSDALLVDEIVGGQAAPDVTFSELVLRLVSSDAFLCESGEELP